MKFSSLQQCSIYVLSVADPGFTRGAESPFRPLRSANAYLPLRLFHTERFVLIAIAILAEDSMEVFTLCDSDNSPR